MSTGGSISFLPGVAGVTDDTFSTQSLCDVAASGAVTPFLRRYVFDPDTSAVVKTDTLLDGTTAYVTTGTVTACAQSDTVISTGIRHTTGVAPLDVKALHAGLQSATLVVLVGTVNVTTDDGAAVPVTAGVALTWSTSDNDDSSLNVLSFTGTAAPADYIVVFTYKSTASGL